MWIAWEARGLPAASQSALHRVASPALPHYAAAARSKWTRSSVIGPTHEPRCFQMRALTARLPRGELADGDAADGELRPACRGGERLELGGGHRHVLRLRGGVSAGDAERQVKRLVAPTAAGAESPLDVVLAARQRRRDADVEPADCSSAAARGSAAARRRLGGDSARLDVLGDQN